MVLADTSVWVDHFRRGDARLCQLLLESSVATHPFIIAELALGSLSERKKTLSYLEMLPHVKVARTEEVRQIIEVHGWFGKGIGFVDVHLMASVLLTPHTVLWTRDRRLREVAARMGVELTVP